MKRRKYKEATQEERDLADILYAFADRLRDEARAIYMDYLPKPTAAEHAFWRALVDRARTKKRRKAGE